MKKDPIQILEKAAEYYQLREYGKSEELLKNITIDDGNALYAQALFNLGILYDTCEKYDLAEKIWQEITLDLDDEWYSLALFNLGLLNEKKGNLIEAEKYWDSITFEMNPSIYARALLCLGILSEEKKDFIGAEKYWASITLEMNPSIYAQALLCLGYLSETQKDLVVAERYWKSIALNMDKAIYAESQLNLALLYEDKKDFVKSEKYFKNITVDMDAESYAIAQLHLGLLNEQNSNFSDAEQHWKNITIDMDLECYLQAKLNMGLLNVNQEKYDNAEQCWKDVLGADSEGYHAQALFNLGLLKYQQDDQETATKYWDQISENMDIVIYAETQLRLGFLQNDENKAKEFWKKITKEMSDQQYFMAQFSLGMVELEQKNFELIEKYWDNIQWTDFDNAQDTFYWLMNELWASKFDEKFRLIQKYISIVPQNLKLFEHNMIEQIIEFSDQTIVPIFENILNIINSVLKKLHLNNIELQRYCNRFAHYTRHTTALTTLSNDTKNAFRLSTMHFMNDPTEGNLIDILLNLTDSQKDNPYLAFASCFSFNHDSLNQFRLYGKTDNKENSGVSLVFKSTFFLDDLSKAYHINNPKFSSILNTYDIDIDDKIGSKSEVKRISLQPLYRCVYIDPDSNYLKIAQRSRLSFYRSNIGSEYNQYVQKIKKIEKDLLKLLRDLNKYIIVLRKNLNKKKDKNLSNQATQLLNEIILPLRYLIKHAAFEEEDECRMIYITHLRDPAIQHNHKEKWFYVEYAEPIRKHIDRVYLGKGAEDYRPFFERLLGEKSKVRVSNNPFRA